MKFWSNFESGSVNVFVCKKTKEKPAGLPHLPTSRTELSEIPPNGAKYYSLGYLKQLTPKVIAL